MIKISARSAKIPFSIKITNAIQKLNVFFIATLTILIFKPNKYNAKLAFMDMGSFFQIVYDAELINVPNVAIQSMYVKLVFTLYKEPKIVVTVIIFVRNLIANFAIL